MTAAPKINSTYVPSEGPKHCDIMVVGEAPGKDEEANGRPFIGRSGNIINSFFADRLGIPREGFYVTNLCKYRPFKNEFKYCLDTPQLEEGLKELREEIAQVNPTVIIACGAWPLYFLAGKTNDKGEAGKGIGNWRGSVVPNTFVEGGPKVIGSYHPAFLLRNWKWHPVTYSDWDRAYEESKYRETRYPVYDLLVDPPNVEEIVREMSQAEFLECDIETFTDHTIACVGFSDRPDRTLVLTYKLAAWREFTEVLLGSPARKIFQYGAFDINFLWRFYAIRTVNYYFDTYVAAATLTPEFPRGLDFLTSMYTRMPYYKVERKEWKATMDMKKLWVYNGKDNIAEYLIAMEQMGDLREDFGWDGRSIISGSTPTTASLSSSSTGAESSN